MDGYMLTGYLRDSTYEIDGEKLRKKIPNQRKKNSPHSHCPEPNSASRRQSDLDQHTATIKPPNMINTTIPSRISGPQRRRRASLSQQTVTLLATLTVVSPHKSPGPTASATALVLPSALAERKPPSPPYADTRPATTSPPVLREKNKPGRNSVYLPRLGLRRTPRATAACALFLRPPLRSHLPRSSVCSPAWTSPARIPRSLEKCVGILISSISRPPLGKN